MKHQALFLVMLLVLAAAIDNSKGQQDIEEKGEEENVDVDQNETEASADDASGELEKRGGDLLNRNIGYLLRGYGILEGNPLDPTRFDPGFKSKIFQATYEKNSMTSDGRFKIPDNVDISSKVACSSSFSSETVSTEADYQRSLMAKASISVSGKIAIVDASFTGSSEYNSKSKLLRKNEKNVIRSEASCTVYEGRIETGTPPKFTDDFLESVKQLAEEPDYGRFLDTFGTHFFISVDMGARFTKLQEISKEKLEELKEQGIDIKTAASVSAGSLGKGDPKLDVKVTKKQTDKFDKAVEQTTIVTIGSKPPADGKTETWLVSAAENPLPISYRLRSIVELFNSAYFKDEDSVDYKKLREELTKYLKGYCKDVKANRLKNVECEGPPKGCAGGTQCSVNAVCTDNPNSKDPDQKYECKCKPGYEGKDGKICSRKLNWIPDKTIEQDSNRGQFGTWGGMENCRNGVFASGYKLRAQKYQRAGDDSGANAVCLTCDDTDVCSKMANEGEWSYPSYECPKGSFLTGWRQNVQDPRGLGLLRDDVALCNVEYKCRSFETWEEVAADMKGQGMEKGTWSRFKECPRGEFICGINTRVEDPNTDDTALNDIRHLCCKPVNARKKKSKKRSKKY